MNAPVMPAPGRFEEVLASARRIEPAQPETTFKPHKDGVLMTVGARTFLLTLAQVDDHLALYEREGRAAEAEAKFCNRRVAALWDARCAAMDEFGATQADAALVRLVGAS
jgi:hypothetical protein